MPHSAAAADDDQDRKHRAILATRLNPEMSKGPAGPGQHRCWSSAAEEAADQQARARLERMNRRTLTRPNVVTLPARRNRPASVFPRLRRNRDLASQDPLPPSDDLAGLKSLKAATVTVRFLPGLWPAHVRGTATTIS